MSDDYVEVDLELVRLTGKAALVKLPDSACGVWVPRSVIHGAHERLLDNTALGEMLTIEIREWFAEREGLS